MGIFDTIESGFSSVTGEFSSLTGGLLGGLGLSSLFGGSSSSSSSGSSWTTYLEYGAIAIGIIILAELIKKMI